MSPEFDFAALAARVVRPERSRLREALGTVLRWSTEQATRWTDASEAQLPLDQLGLRGILDPQEAWQAFAARGVIPEAWLEEPGRRFAVSHELREQRWPTSVRAAVTLAADPEGVVAAEALAREAADRLGLWGGSRASRVVWRVVPEPRMRREVWPVGLEAVLRAEESLAAGIRPVLDAFGRGRALRPEHDWPDAFYDARVVVRAAAAWDLLAAQGAVVPAVSDEVPQELVGKSFASLPDPFDPLLGLLARGYVLGTVGVESLGLTARVV